ncbi:PBECR2 nuclease fold domain-containing protein [uncultured Desulfuromusa sp.]|uniref:PBECR2 nuclease fold domain-containing protein n=1 Tax=uncultured Desulfuromusa sp. TaxID=219183 RepID=UPI002AA61AE5|nr:PBECR2 nuclease fold domain-containing protein [uncultured Desulfuromusa sp.]
MRDDLLTDFRSAVDKAISEGTTLETFRKDFDIIVAKHGWSYNGGRNWRSNVIYSTNIRTAYMAGRWKQLTDPELLKLRPYLEYRHGDSLHPRLPHLAWDGTILPADDPWWQTHYTPNGWGCKCKVFSVSERDLERMGKTGPDKAPAIEIDSKTGAPVGIDKGWDYNVGQAAWGRSHQLRLMEDQGPWTDLIPWGPEKYGRGAVPIDAAQAERIRPVPVGDEAALRQALRDSVGGDAVNLTDPAGEKVRITQALVDHMVEGGRFDKREEFFPLIPELIENPAEIWINFARSEVSGRVALRRRYVKLIKLDKTQSIGLVADIQGGYWVGMTFFRGSKTALKNLRKGRLVFGRE